MPCGRKHPVRRKLIRHEESRYTVGQAKRHLRHHKGTKLLAKQIKSSERTDKE